MNALGKTLVLIHVAASLLFMGFASAIFFQQMDWGWKEPRKDLLGKERLPSEIDQRSAALTESQQMIALVMPALDKAQKELTNAEPRLYQNHLWYRDRLVQLETDPKPLNPKEIKLDKGMVVLDTPVIGKPVLGKNVPDLDKSYAQYVVELKEAQKTIDDALAGIAAENEEQHKLTYQLTGKDNAGVSKQPGLYGLVDEAYQDQVRTKYEIDYLRLQFAEVMRQISQYDERYDYLKDNLARIKKARTGK